MRHFRVYISWMLSWGIYHNYHYWHWRGLITCLLTSNYHSLKPSHTILWCLWSRNFVIPTLDSHHRLHCHWTRTLAGFPLWPHVWSSTGTCTGVSMTARICKHGGGGWKRGTEIIFFCHYLVPKYCYGWEVLYMFYILWGLGNWMPL